MDWKKQRLSIGQQNMTRSPFGGELNIYVRLWLFSRNFFVIECDDCGRNTTI